MCKTSSMSSVHPKNVVSSTAKCSTNNNREVLYINHTIYTTVQYTKNPAEVAKNTTTR